MSSDYLSSIDIECGKLLISNPTGVPFMNLSCLLYLLDEVPGYRRLKEGIASGNERDWRLALPQGARAYFVAALHRSLDMPVLLVVSRDQDARVIYEELKLWCPCPASVQMFPEPDLIGEKSTDDPCKAAERSRVLSALVACRDGLSPCPLVVASARAAASETMSPDDFAQSCYVLEIGMTLNLQRLLDKLLSMGYQLENLVEVPGSVARKGGVIDIFSTDSELPARIELFGNRIESIRHFDPRTQRSIGHVTSVKVVPANGGGSYQGSLLDYFVDNGLLVVDGSVFPRVAAKEVDLAGEKGGVVAGDGRLPSEVVWEMLSSGIKEAKRRLFFSTGGASGADDPETGSIPLAPVIDYGGKLQYLPAELTRLRKYAAVVIVSQQVERLAEFLDSEGVEVNVVSELTQIPLCGSVVLVRGWLNAGWRLGDRVVLFTDREIFGFVKQQRSFKKRPVRYHWLVSELAPGDYVVHVEHGIGRFVGLTRMLVDDVEREYLALEYAAGDRLYVPVEQAERVSRYVGGAEPALTRLGTQEWARTKQRVKESILNMARELLELYARRQLAVGFAFSRDTLWQQELEASFPYVETPDQIEAVNAVKRDMEKPRPMDRLVCGDVGYGKTEVALRAAFKAVMDGKQVALLVPTTVLAQQHFNTFRERLQAFPVRVEMLSRFCTEKEQQEVITGLATGAVDICIGTHRLLQKDVVFKDLGLVIIDEEQRFGVVHKEHFKRLRQEVDVLTLSATPIPRTLHMALSDIRDMSIIETPPEERLPVKIYVGAYDERLVRTAILREVTRDGQVFYVHNRIHDVYAIARKLEELVPEVKILVAHGRMPEGELEAVITKFVNREADVLVTTTIIESGLDMPSVNTLIVDQADMLGLTQLYQLRGRVGRGCNHAYAYFFYDAKKRLTPEAWKRLKTIAEATELGAGFTVAMRDLEIRGAGNLLGTEQSGYVVAVGFDLYCRMLSEAVEELKRSGAIDNKTLSMQLSPRQVDLPLSAYIPEEYVPDLGTRLSYYRRLADAKHPKEVAGIATEMVDRFGDTPEAVRNLLYVVRIKQLAARAQIDSIFRMGKYIVIQFGTNRGCRGAAGREGHFAGLKLGDGQVKIDTRALGDKWPEVLEKFLGSLAM